MVVLLIEWSSRSPLPWREGIKGRGIDAAFHPHPYSFDCAQDRLPPSRGKEGSKLQRSHQNLCGKLVVFTQFKNLP